MRRTPPMPAEQRARPNTRVAHVQLEIKSAPRQILTTGERGQRGPRQDPQMAKSSWPQGRNRGIYHGSLRSTPPYTLVPTQHLKKPDVNLKCRLCGRFDETIDHLVSGCPELAKTKYIHRHNKAAAHMHWKICKEFGIEVKERCYEHEPKTVTENDSVTILWDMPIHTDRTIAANRPDIVLRSKKDKTCLLIDMTIPLDTNTSVKTLEKLTKYVQRLGNRG